MTPPNAAPFPRPLIRVPSLLQHDAYTGNAACVVLRYERVLEDTRTTSFSVPRRLLPTHARITAIVCCSALLQRTERRQ